MKQSSYSRIEPSSIPLKFLKPSTNTSQPRCDSK